MKLKKGQYGAPRGSRKGDIEIDRLKSMRSREGLRSHSCTHSIGCEETYWKRGGRRRLSHCGVAPRGSCLAGAAKLQDKSCGEKGGAPKRSLPSSDMLQCPQAESLGWKLLNISPIKLQSRTCLLGGSVPGPSS